MDNTDKYVDTAFCPNCIGETDHLYFSYCHERDSSGDYRECKQCGWRKYVHSDSYEKPFDYDAHTT